MRKSHSWNGRFAVWGIVLLVGAALAVVVVLWGPSVRGSRSGSAAGIKPTSEWTFRITSGLIASLQELDGQPVLTVEVPTAVPDGSCARIVPRVTVEVTSDKSAFRDAEWSGDLGFEWDGSKMMVPTQAVDYYNGPRGGVETVLSIEPVADEERTWRVMVALTFLGLKTGPDQHNFEYSTSLLLKVVPSENVFLTSDSSAPGTVESSP